MQLQEKGMYLVYNSQNYVKTPVTFLMKMTYWHNVFGNSFVEELIRFIKQYEYQIKSW